MKQTATYSGIDQAVDALPRLDALRTMLQSHLCAAAAVEGALPQIDRAAEVVAEALRHGSTLAYAAAGSSALMALSDASELPGTFRIPQGQIRMFMAGGVPTDAHMPGDTEDDTDAARTAAATLRAGDVAIVVSASGTTPYALAFADAGRDAGAHIIAIANVTGSALLDRADVAVALPTAPEVVSGSTRLGAGTAQKIALNMISTQAGILLGHVHDGLMVNLNPENAKLRARAAGIVTQIAGVAPAAAEAALTASGHEVKLAVLMARGLDMAAGQALLLRHGGRLRHCLPQIDEATKTR